MSKPKRAIAFDPFCPITSVEWRSNAENRNIAHRVFSNPEFTAMYSIMIMERPGKTEIPVSSTPSMLATQCAFTAGYEYALMKLTSFANELPEQKPQPEPTFKDEE